MSFYLVARSGSRTPFRSSGRNDNGYRATLHLDMVTEYRHSPEESESSPNPGTLEQIQPRTLWESEASSFTPWLAANLILPGRALSLDLDCPRPKRRSAFSCDIHARDTGRDRQVIIENQLEPTDHRHLGQLLTYAPGLDASCHRLDQPGVPRRAS